jgi:hypothetical protein
MLSLFLGPWQVFDVAVLRRFLRYPLAASDLPCDRGTAYPKLPIYAIAWSAAHWFLIIFHLTAPQWQRRRALKKQSTIDQPTLTWHTVTHLWREEVQ